MAAEVDQKVLEHDAVDNVGVTDKAGDKGIFGFVVNILRGANRAGSYRRT